MGSSRSWFTYEELEAATAGFSRANLLGEGGFGCVYKGFLPGGQVVAVKQLKVGSGQGEREFRAEVEIISRVHHRHLVSLVGYCIADAQRLLVYDFVPNGTLEHHLHGKGRPVMDWPTRLKIASGSARGLAYLHEDCHPRIIHRDIKSSNILLDNNFDAQVSDFGLAKLASDTYTHVTTRVMGTFGYLAPEYASTGKLTEKSDVYSFGVVLLELITGRRPVDTTQRVGDESLVEWARPYLTQAIENGDLDGIVDERLANYNENEMLRMVEAAAACVRHSASKRPRMAQVVRALESDGAISGLNQGVKPGHSSNFTSADYDSNQYASDMKRFRKAVFGSQEHGSSEHSGPPTSEYGMNPSVSSSEGMSSMEMERRRAGLLRSSDTTSSSEINANTNTSDRLNGR
ncbi:hypothetical protein SELMODRAFT_133636 [Selaginella moellendorffii]|uniref:non-specific serine/threonine protein kinase n=2 Tax=Selaginella moellendorffii TaxID=88036 RepID=D8T7F2_SELML|nr:hypothetical protein SELMODRAFT_133636 [Selaginella moellendorffii]